MPEETSLKRNTDDEVIPQRWDPSITDWVEYDGTVYGKDENGVLHPLKTNENGELEIVAAEDANGNPQKLQVDENGNLNVKQNGSIVEEREIISRQTIQDDERIINYNYPDGMQKMMLELRVHELTGTEPEIAFEIDIRSVAESRPLFSTPRNYYPETGHHIITIDNNKIDIELENEIIEYHNINTTLSLWEEITISVRVRGDFEEGEGIDCEVNGRFIL